MKTPTTVTIFGKTYDVQFNQENTTVNVPGLPKQIQVDAHRHYDHGANIFKHFIWSVEVLNSGGDTMAFAEARQLDAAVRQAEKITRKTSESLVSLIGDSQPVPAPKKVSKKVAVKPETKKSNEETGRKVTAIVSKKTGDRIRSASKKTNKKSSKKAAPKKAQKKA